MNFWLGLGLSAGGGFIIGVIGDSISPLAIVVSLPLSFAWGCFVGNLTDWYKAPKWFK